MSVAEQRYQAVLAVLGDARRWPDGQRSPGNGGSAGRRFNSRLGGEGTLLDQSTDRIAQRNALKWGSERP